MTRLARCDKLWRKKSTEARRTGESQEQDQENDEARPEADCREDKSEEVMKFRRHQYEENPGMSLSGEDVQLVMECDHFGPGVTEYLILDCDDCGKSSVREDYTMSVIGNDVVCLFPSLDSVNTGKIVREEVKNSTMEVDGFNVKLGLNTLQ